MDAGAASSVMVINQNYYSSWRLCRARASILLRWIAGGAGTGRKKPNRPAVHQHGCNRRGGNFNSDCARRIHAVSMGVAAPASRR